MKRLLYIIVAGLVVTVIAMPASALTPSSGIGTDAGTQAVFTAPQGGAIGADAGMSLEVGGDAVTSWMDLQATINQMSTEARTWVAVKSIQVEQNSVQASQFPIGMKVVANDAAQQIAGLRKNVLRADNGTAADIAMQNDVMIAAKTMIQADQSKIPQIYGMDVVAAQTNQHRANVDSGASLLPEIVASSFKVAQTYRASIDKVVSTHNVGVEASLMPGSVFGSNFTTAMSNHEQISGQFAAKIGHIAHENTMRAAEIQVLHIT